MTDQAFPQNSPLNELLQQELLVARHLDQQTAQTNASGAVMEVPNAGKLVSSAYEQFRNAAEYSEEHLLLQRAIKRFCKRNLFLTKRRSHALGNELIVELVQAGYLREGTFSKATAAELDQLMQEYMVAFADLRRNHVEYEAAMDWILALISSAAESMLSPHHSQLATVLLAYNHFLQKVPEDRFFDISRLNASDGDYESCLYIAVHQALLKSDIDVVRHEMLLLYKQSPQDTDGFIRFNQQIDTMYSSQVTSQLKRIVSRYGAPFRVLKSLVDSRSDVAEIVADKQLFIDAYDQQIAYEYHNLRQRFNRHLIKSIVFIFITKVVIGVAIEIPYDVLVFGYVAVLPLAVNLLFPPLYLASLKLTLKAPSASNAETVRSYMETLLYGNGGNDSLSNDASRGAVQIPARRQSSAQSTLAYGLLFMVPLAATVFVLGTIGFNMMQMIIFFIFFSTASFLGFRLSSMVRELELTTRQVGLLNSLREFFYLPFIVVGQWLSRKYGKINLVGHFLDVGIELPLKTVLRLLRQWVRFVSEKRDELY